MQKKLPIGIENFEDMIKENYYYVDKTGLLKQLLNEHGLVNLFTRPRRFGKSLNMSMLKYFFEIGNDQAIFEGLEISKDKELCDQYQGKFPVISVSLKGAKAGNYEDAKAMMKYIMAAESRRLYDRMSGDKLSEKQKEQMKSLMSDNMKDTELMTALWILSSILKEYYGEKVIILIDEYDVPLDKAFENNYYNEMIILLRNMLKQSLKTNDNLYMAVLTGCLRIARESIFTGLNNFNIFSITDQYFDEYFGFTDKEVKEILQYYKVPEAFEQTKKWYDGYRFGNTDIYCPWDVINHCRALKVEPDATPQPYWINTSGNYIVKRFIEKANQQTRREIEQLIEGKAIQKEIRLELTYNELDSTIENLWSVLFATGYLTQQGKPQGRTYSLIIPNESIRQIFIEQIQEWFKETTRKDENRLKDFCKAFEEGNAEAIEEQFNNYLMKTISIRDTFTTKKENFYHGVLLGLLSYDPDWYITSNQESGDGYSDIMIEAEQARIGIIIEVKYAENIKTLDKACQKALKQIKEKNYDQKLEEEGYETILNYGIACYKKRCKVLVDK
ncbi:ATP-binding protein [Anaerostipes hadrus]|uniref:AAA family ATPase n=1 Tax=Anaerostipes hadrus TaxID=649756 RepID=UPI000348BB32|nr:AAA family ATPase [Anaerostipes hadrus]MCB6170917.1 ATP-binding protein [Anaerostipes hadrus]MCB6652057.1 ATP-binding protein [Anaerostipes hadrus]MCB6655226.1 ATP-binding protein [Anaerostipes hadrus]MCB6679564.1 ATP-binding protein [Anaerostipes hadrus]MCB6743258.1 ATP-binding protein [Anaerostipes hadrus]